MSTPWERVAAGRYAAQFHGHIIQAIRKDGPYDPNGRPYIAVVDKVPLEPGEWSLNRAKTKAMQHVLRHKSRKTAEEVFQKPPPRPVETVVETTFDEIPDLLELPAPEVVQEAGGLVREQPELVREQPELLESTGPSAAITARITDPDTLRGLNNMREMLALMREYADVKCVVNLPPTMEL